MSSANTLTTKHQKALQLIKEGHSIRSAEAHTGLSRSAIFRAKKRCEKGDTSFGVSGRPSCMTKDEEALLRKNLVIYREDNGVDASQTTVLSIAQDIINNRPLEKRVQLSRSWLHGYIARSKDLQSVIPHKVEGVCYLPYYIITCA